MTSIGSSGRQRLSREFQRRLLTKLSVYYPHAHVGRWQELDEDESTVKTNLLYLQQHGLINTDAKVNRQFGQGFTYSYSQLTKDGMDFLEQDGGLSAILGVVTIKLHDETVKSLIEHKIMESDLSPSDKRRYVDGLRELPSETTKHLVLKLVDLGLGKGQQAIEWLGTYLDSL